MRLLTLNILHRIIAFIGICGVVLHTTPSLGQDDDESDARAFLTELATARSLDSHLRIQTLKKTLDKNAITAHQREILKELIFLTINNGNTEDLRKYGSLGQAIAEKTDDNELKIYSTLAFAEAAGIEGLINEQGQKIEAISVFAQQTGDENSIFFVETLAAIHNINKGDFLSGLNKLSSNINTLPESTRGNWMRLTAYLTLALTFTNIDDLENGIEHYKKALNLARRHGIAVDRETMMHNIINSLIRLRQYDLAEEYIVGLNNVIEEIGRPAGHYYLYYNLALLRYGQERYEDVLINVKQALTYPLDVYFDADLYDLAAISSAKLGDPDQAQKYLDQSQLLFSITDSTTTAATYAQLTRAHILYARRKFEEAFHALDRAHISQLDQQFQSFTNSVSNYQSSLDTILARQKAEYDLIVAQKKNTTLIVLSALLFIATLFGILVMQYRHNRQLDRARIDAERANRAKSEFLANMSHELRTPLNAILGFSEMMTQRVFGKLGSRQYEDYAEYIHQSGSLLLDIINDILDLSKVESGAVKLSEELLDLHMLMEDSRTLLNKRAQLKEIDIEIELPDNTPALYADERLIKQILLNLLSNAVKFTPKRGTVILCGYRTENGKLAIMVKDNGPGMTEDELALALIPFGQAGTTLTRSHEGTGLGLPLTKTLVELHGGVLNVITRKDEGTRIDIIFPRERCMEPPVKKKKATAAKKDDSH